MAQGRVLRWDVVDAIMDLRSSIEGGDFVD
jgi:hypothetical protein